MSYSAAQACDHISELVVNCLNSERRFSHISAADHYDHNSLVFVSDKQQLNKLAEPLPSIIVTRPEFLSSLENNGSAIIVVENVRLAQALIKQRYCDGTAPDSEWPTIHPSANIHKSVQLGVGSRIGANTVIGQNVIVGDNTYIRANCVIEHDTIIGDDCVIHNMVNIGFASVLGSRVIVRPGAVIGNEGFGFAQDQYKHYHRIPHTGSVLIHDDVQIGSNSNIDRGTYGKTTISRGVKIDALCHIAHNVFIDEDALFVAQSGVAGSSNIGKRVVASGQTGVLDHRKVADDAILVHRCGVTEDILSSGMWAGTPPKPFREYVSNLNSYEKLKKLEKRIDEKLNRLEQLTTQQ